MPAEALALSALPQAARSLVRVFGLRASNSAPRTTYAFYTHHRLIPCALGAACFLGLGAGCSSLDYDAVGKDGVQHHLHVSGFGNKRAIRSLRIGDAVMEGYMGDQVEALKAVAEGVAKGLAQGAKPVP